MGNTLGNRIVGKPIDPSPPIPAPTNPEPAFKVLDTQITRLEKRITHLTTLLNTARKQAQEAAQQGDKSKAMRLLSRAKEHESSVQTHQAMLNRLIQQRDLLEKTEFQTETLRTMEQVNHHLKHSSPVTIEKAETIIDEVTELKQTADEVMNILTAPIHDTVTQDELEREVQAMMAAAPQPILLPKPAAILPALPVAPLPPTGFPAPATVAAAATTKPTVLQELEAI